MIVRYALDCGTRVLAPRKRGELAPIMRSYLGARASGPSTPPSPPQAGGEEVYDPPQRVVKIKP